MLYNIEGEWRGKEREWLGGLITQPMLKFHSWHEQISLSKTRLMLTTHLYFYCPNHETIKLME